MFEKLKKDIKENWPFYIAEIAVFTVAEIGVLKINAAAAVFAAVVFILVYKAVFIYLGFKETQKSLF